jgi:tubulin epsilon
MKRNSAVTSAASAAANPAQTGPAAAAAERKQKPWDKMNNIVATMLLNLTSSARYEGALNVDMNEITTNLVPFPRLHFLVASQTPLYALADVRVPPRRLDQMFTDAFDRHHQLVRCDPRRGRYMACALMLRGKVEISDIRRNIDRIMPTLNFVPWNPEGWKTGLCGVPPLRQERALLCLANNTCIKPVFQGLQSRFQRLYRKGAYKHHFTAEGMDASQFDVALDSLRSLIGLYSEVEAEQPGETPPRLKVV